MYQSSEINIGNIKIGGKNPLCVQSMTNTDTADINATYNQTIQLYNAGCQMVRITVPTIKEIDAIIALKNKLKQNNITLPIIADVHFSTKVALDIAQYVEKLRINPGNYIDNQTQITRFDEKDKVKHIEKLHKNLLPLLKVCKQHNTAIRIGSNLGSLSKRIIYQYGNTPEGMVEAAMEFLRICQIEDFNSVVVSIKASNPKTMVWANRLLVKKMQAENMSYPIHLGVTEAGNESEGIMKSCMGIGTLLHQGIGDTIRVSLTGKPQKEIPVAIDIANYYKKNNNKINNANTSCQQKPLFDNNPYNLKLPVIVAEKKHPQADICLDNTTICFDNINNNNIAHFIDKHKDNNCHAIISINENSEVYSTYNTLLNLKKTGWNNPVILKINSKKYTDIYLSCDASIFLIDNLVQGIWIHFNNKNTVEKSFDLLQAAGNRITKPEYISCPTCGRTQVDLEKLLTKVKQKTANLAGIKIAVMGCIVNGPGEMADADFGIMGAGKNKTYIYKGQTILEKNIPENNAVERLLFHINQQ